MSKKKASQLPSLTSLFQDSWLLFQETWVSYLKLIGLGIAFLFLGALIGILISLPIGFIVVGSHFQIFHHLTPFNIGILVLLALWILVYILSIVAMSVLFPITGIFILQKEKVSPVIDLLKQAKHFFWAYFLTMLFVGLLILGGMTMMIIPGIVMSIFFFFIPYEIVLEKQSGVAALTRSYFLVKSHFWQIVGRIALLEIGIVIINTILGRIAKGDFLLSLVQVVVSLLVGWYALSYLFVLYKQIREGITFPQQQSLLWIWIVSGIGLLIFLLGLGWLFIGFGLGNVTLPNLHPEHMHAPHISAA